MQILDGEQIRGWDAYTILHEPVTSINLMERAAKACYNWLMTNGYRNRSFAIYCGKGNNGGDGLAIARMLIHSGHTVSVYILEFGNKGSDDFQSNLSLLHELTTSIVFISSSQTIHPLPKESIVIDSLFGSGLNKPLDGLSCELADHINQSGNTVISIDIPSGMYADKSSKGNAIVRANHVVSFQCFKLAFMMVENAPFIGDLHILDIGLHPGYLHTISGNYHLIDHELAGSILRKRVPYAHKGLYGHAALIAGSKGMMGAAIMAAGSCLRSGVGKLSCHIPGCGYIIMQTSTPEAMCVVENEEDYIKEISSLDRYDALGIGPGWGRHSSEVKLLTSIFNYKKPLVIDADALNALADNPSLHTTIPHSSVLTPHLKEFGRLFGEAADDFQRMDIARQKANALQTVIVLKGKHTLVATPGGNCFFNGTGNAGMAKGGSGDILTGMVLAFLAQGYPAEHAACLSVYLHGRAADIAVERSSYESMLPTDYMQCIGSVIRELY